MRVVSLCFCCLFRVARTARLAATMSAATTSIEVNSGVVGVGDGLEFVVSDGFDVGFWVVVGLEVEAC